MITKLRCSSMGRVMACRGSLNFKDLFIPEAGEPAKEGTAAAEYLERLLKNQPLGTHASNGVPFNDEMAYHLKPLADSLTDENDDGVYSEQQVSWQTRSGIMIEGTYDVSFVRGDALYIDDLKWGYGIVEAQRNWQLISYAVGEVIKRGKAFKEIHLRIHQPRPHHEDGPTRDWTITYEDLIAYKEDIEKQCDLIASGNFDLSTSNHCKYCPAAAEACPAFNKAVYRGFEWTQEFVQDKLSGEEISHQLDMLARVKDLVKIKGDSLEALAIQKLKAGEKIPNYNTVDRLGDRKWKAEVTPELIKMMTGVDVTETKMITPPQAERAGVNKKFLVNLVDRPYLGQKLTKVDEAKLGDKIFGQG